jgi:Fe-coproporphyrin III synthase
MQRSNILWANIAVTYRCNSLCTRCNIWKIYKNNPTKLKEELSFNEIKGIFENSALLNNIKIFNVTGGEPWLRRDFVELTSFLIRKYPEAAFIVPTNAIDANIVFEKLRDIVNSCSPWNFQLAISLDGLAVTHDRVRGVNGNFKKALLLIDQIKQHFPQIGLSISFTGGPDNYQDLMPVYELTKKLEIEFGCQLVQMSSNYYQNENINFEWNAQQLTQIKEALNPIIENCRKKNGPQLDAYFLEQLTDFAKNPMRMAPCYSATNSFFMDPYGNVYPCILINNPMGNIREQSFDEIWLSSKAQEIRQFISLNKCSCWTPCETMPSLYENIHPFENAIKAKDAQIAALTNAIQAKELQLQRMQENIVYRLLKSQQRFVDKLLQHSTRRQRIAKEIRGQ